ncbi:type I polyketide synthase [Lentzea flaviverrucosa]|uniref:Acyl transferase domain-containing protein n=1 Tax=Lentzea flaviverrucosa TaxID=200379 RepID=A0A1H9WUF1_9PSEU|nr:type I polyketide synthase [Lentzea flaviverrucosa]RDI23116.1 acyl transferase domain-containing protein [Lentzea flaviverrucosa]SES37546.1 Acyl transferase domain-containing protein [Lentzea flaviverrucosa]
MNDVAEPVAIIGLAGRFPGASNVGQYWRNLERGTETIAFPSDDELAAIGVPHDALTDPDYVKAVALAPGVDQFDPGFFGFTPKEAKLADPQLRLFLETSHAAIENAGYDPHRIADVGVFGSAGVNRYAELHGSAGGAVRSASGISLGVLNNSDYIATLVSYKFDFRGPSMTVQTACSSSLVAAHLAIQALRNGECSMAIAGGADVEFPVGHGHWWAPGSPLSRDGHCRPFDRDANGTIFGSGVGVVVLKRLGDAIADGDHIRAVIRGTAINNDGSDKVGFSAPSVSGQAAAVVEAMLMAGVRPDQVSYVEAHATGTPLGDPIEVAALTSAYRRLAADVETGSVALGSVKGNIGHLGHAAGAASLIKTVLALENETLPASINFSDPNPKLGLEQSPFHVNDTTRAWPRTEGSPRIAAINSLGIGGTNVHAIIEEAPVRPSATPVERPRLVVWSAKSEQARDALRDELATTLAARDDVFLADAVATLRHGRTAHPVRSAVVVANAGEAGAVLTGQAAVVSGTAGGRRPVTFLFPGQGSQHAAMAVELHATEPVFAAAFDECLDLFEQQGVPARERWRSAAADEELQHTALAQPLLFAVEYALSRMWRSWGVEPVRLLGHSVGELTAAVVAEVFSLPDAVLLVAARARAMAAMPAGAMLAVSAPEDQVRSLLPGTLTVSAVNAPRQVVVAGAEDEIARFAELLAERGLPGQRVRTSHAFHSPSMAPAAAEFEAAFSGVELRAPKIAVFSAATGARLTDAEATDPEFWAGQLTASVLFGDALSALLGDAPQVLLEVGPGRVLSSVAKQHPQVVDGESAVAMTLPRRGSGMSEWKSVLTAVGQLWVEGHEIDWTALDPAPMRRVELPGYPYERQRCWIETAEPVVAQEPAAPAVAAEPGGGQERADDPSPFSTVIWQQTPLDMRTGVEGEVTALVLLPDERARAVDVVTALQQAGMRVVAVHRSESYRETAGGGFQIRPHVADDHERMFAALAERGSYPGLVVHALTLGEWEPPAASTVSGQLHDSFHTLLHLVQQGARKAGSAGLPHVLVLTDRSVDVSGGETVNPVKAVLHGLARTLPLEEPRVTCKVVDIGAGIDEDDLVAELVQWNTTEIVALRGRRRWTRTFDAYHPVPDGRTSLRRNGVYLITGGTGGLGLEVAKGLVRTGLRPNLVLLSRRGLAEGAELDDLLRAGDQDTVRVHDAVQELEELGARCRVVAADVTNARAVRRAVDIAVAEFGALHGVLHLAGVPGGGMLHLRGHDDADAVLAPKVLGTLALGEALRGKADLDFFVSFSSTAAVDGLLGSGDYAAGNAFLDAHAESVVAPRGRVLSINWPAWNTVGMAVPGLRKIAGAAEHLWSARLDPRSFPILDEHRINGRAVLPGTAYLDFAVRAFRAKVLAGAAGSVELGNVVFQRPLVVEEPRVLEVSFERDGERWRFVVSSRTEARSDDVRIHTVGTAAVADRPRRQVDVGALQARMSDRRRPPTPQTARRLFALGPRWNNITTIGFDPETADEKLLWLDLPDVYAAEIAEHELHPTLLDTATSFVRDPERDDFHMPFTYRSVVVHESIPAKLFSHIRRRPGAERLITADVDLVDEGGAVVVEVTGFAMRRVGEGFDVTAESAAEQDVAVEDGRQAVPPQTGIDPEVGVALLIRLLEARTPRQVVVAPFRDGKPLVRAATRVTAVEPVRAAAAELTPAKPEVTSSAAQPVVPAAPAGSGSVLEALREMWTEALGMPQIDPGDDFFDLGGNSLTAVELMTLVRKRFAIDLSIASLFEFPTLAGLADELSALGAKP